MSDKSGMCPMYDMSYMSVLPPFSGLDRFDLGILAPLDLAPSFQGPLYPLAECRINQTCRLCPDLVGQNLSG